MRNPLFAHQPDPNFPDRPDHPDFWEMVDAVQEMDNLADSGEGSIQAFFEVMGFDADSLAYMARQRGLRAVRVFPDSGDQVRGMGASWMDGFMTAMVMMRHRQSAEVEVMLEGSHRTNQQGEK